MTYRAAKETGVRHLVSAASYSLGGARRAWRETAFRHEVFGSVALLLIYASIGASLMIVVCAIILFLMLLAAEAVNTAIEEIIDRISPEFSETGKHAKDLGSFAVFCMLVANGVVLAYAVYDWALVEWHLLQKQPAILTSNR